MQRRLPGFRAGCGPSFRLLAVLAAFVCMLFPWRGSLARASSSLETADFGAVVAHAGMAFVAESHALHPAGASVNVLVLAHGAAQASADQVMVVAAANVRPLEFPSIRRGASSSPAPQAKPAPVRSPAPAKSTSASPPSADAAAPAFLNAEPDAAEGAVKKEQSGGKTGAIRLFKTVEFRGALKNMPKWQRVVEAEGKSPTFEKDLSKFMRGSVYKQWTQLVERTKGASVLDKAKAVTAFFNRWPYRTDQDVYKVADYWATPAEFMQKSGDCEDYAIAKFYALIKLGVPAESMRIVALKDTIRNLAHAILVVYTNNDAYVLDNLTDMVLSHARYQHYQPQYSVSAVYRWAHVRPKKAK